ncbi:GNL3L, partial [Cordylochernes scorpioides]
MKKKQKEERQKLMEQNRSVSTLLQEAQKKLEKFEEKRSNACEDDKTGSSQVSTATRGFKKDYSQVSWLQKDTPADITVFAQVLESADIILHVLDARDPLGTCFPQLEEKVLNSPEPKKLVYVLNKIDLIPKDNLVSWLHYLRTRCPTVPFKASTQAQRRNLVSFPSPGGANYTSQKKVKVSKVMSDEHATGFSSACVGANLLMKLIGSYCPGDDPRPVTIGVVGFPNVGKSSVINSLKRSRGLRMMVPGATDAGAILRNALRIETIEDPIIPATYVVQRAGREQMALHYQVRAFSSPTELFLQLAKKMGQLKKGGIPNIDEGARRLLRDWTSGKIKYFTVPPELPQDTAHSLTDDLMQQESAELSTLPPVNTTQCFPLPSAKDVPDFQLVEQEEEVAMEEETPAYMSQAIKKRPEQQEDQKSIMPLNNTQKADFRKMKKKAKRA